MDFDPILLSRIQFGLTIGFHILFPTLSIGLAALIAVHEGLWLKTRNLIYKQACLFWSKIFALSFGMGVVSGVVLSYEIGTNFAGFSEATGNVLGPLFSYEVLTAFFLEAGFLGIMIFGWNRVPPWLHFMSTCMVAIGTCLSAFWILAANSWMHTPAGYEFVDGVFAVSDWWAVIFNPSFPYRLAHMLVACYLTTALVVMGISAWYVYHELHEGFARTTLTLAIVTASILAPLQIVLGDLHGLNTQEHQPMKVAAMEGRWDTMAGAPLLLIAIPNQDKARNDFEIGIPLAASLILQHDPNGVVKGLKEVPANERPRVVVVFYAFRVMLALGALFLLLSWTGLILVKRNRVHRTPGYLKACMLASPLGFVAVIAGWIVTEVGRQPWVVHGLLRTDKSVSTALQGPEVALSLTLFIVIYSGLLFAFVYFLLRIIRKGPNLAPAMRLPEQGEAKPAFMVEGN